MYIFVQKLKEPEVDVKWQFINCWFNKKLSYRKEAAQTSVSLKILLSIRVTQVTQI